MEKRELCLMVLTPVPLPAMESELTDVAIVQVQKTLYSIKDPWNANVEMFSLKGEDTKFIES